MDVRIRFVQFQLERMCRWVSETDGLGIMFRYVIDGEWL